MPPTLVLGYSVVYWNTPKIVEIYLFILLLCVCVALSVNSLSEIKMQLVIMCVHTDMLMEFWDTHGIRYGRKLHNVLIK